MSQVQGGATVENVDVVVIGGGPGGSTCAYHLARRGLDVVVIERARHPRFQVGESLVPYITALLEEMGVAAGAQAPFLRVKRSVETSDAEGGYFRTRFSSMADGQHKFGYSVERSHFDAHLLDRARSAGARVYEDSAVTGVIEADGRVVGVAYDRDGHRGEARARFVVDASGRTGVLARHFKLRRMNRRLNKVALYQYYDGIQPGHNAADDGDLVVATHEDGWVWCMPVGPDARSVGTVMPASELSGRAKVATYENHLARAPSIAACLAGARPRFDGPEVCSDFSYHSEHLVGAGWFLVGDAGCFVDPIFSGGVFFSMVGGRRVAHVIDEIVAGADEDRTSRGYENFAKTGFDHYFRFVYAFHESCGGNVACVFQDLFPGHFKILLQIMAGDFWSDEDNPVWRSLRARDELATFNEPFEPVFGCPVYPDIARPEPEPAQRALVSRKANQVTISTGLNADRGVQPPPK